MRKINPADLKSCEISMQNSANTTLLVAYAVLCVVQPLKHETEPAGAAMFTNCSKSNERFLSLA
jgi:hypothetical protein